MYKNLLWIKAAYWLGIIADFLEAVFMIFPSLYLKTIPVDLPLDPGFIYGMRYGAPVMVGWTALLYWAQRKPVERKDILLITALFPVIGYYIFRVYALSAGFISLRQTLPTLVIQTVLFVLLLGGYQRAKAIGMEK